MADKLSRGRLVHALARHPYQTSGHRDAAGLLFRDHATSRRPDRRPVPSPSRSRITWLHLCHRPWPAFVNSRNAPPLWQLSGSGSLQGGRW